MSLKGYGTIWDSWVGALIIFGTMWLVIALMDDNRGEQYTLIKINKSDKQCVKFAKDWVNEDYNKALRNPELWQGYHQSAESYALDNLATSLRVSCSK